MSGASQRKARPQHVRTDEPDISFYHANRLEPGEYTAFCRSARVYRDRQFRRWLCVVQFDVWGDSLMEVIGRVSWFLNLGSGAARERVGGVIIGLPGLKQTAGYQSAEIGFLREYSSAGWRGLSSAM